MGIRHHPGGGRPPRALPEPARLTVAILVALTLAACGGGDEPAGPEPPDPVPSLLAITPQSVELAMGASQQLSVTVLDQFGNAMSPQPAGFTPQWSSDDTTRVTIDGAGLARGIRIGQATLRVAAGSLQESVPAHVLGVTPQLESERAVSMEIGPGGGVLETQSVGGIGYRLEIPSLALAEPTTITLTPISGLANAPMLTFHGGARFAPDGLVLTEPAKLTIELSGEPGSASLVGVVFPDDGSGLTLEPVTRSGTQVTLLVPHFSGAGVVTLDEEDALPPPAEDEDPAVEAVFALADENADGSPDAATVVTILRRWYQDGVRPKLQGAAVEVDGDLYGPISEWRFWLGMLIVLPELADQVLDALSAEIDEARHLAANALRSHIDALNLECVTGRNWLSALGAFGVQHLAEEYGLAGEASGMDRESFLEGLCLDIGYAAVELPEEIEEDVPVDVQFQAGISYTGGPPDDFSAPLRTTVTVSGGTASPDSLGLNPDNTGAVTVTPDGPSLSVTLHTCFDLDVQPASLLQPSVVCADTTISRGSMVVYEQGFDDSPGPEWSLRSRATSPGGERFLGIFNNVAPTLTLTDLPAHSTIRIEVDFYALGSLDGSRAEDVGPDVMEFSADGEPILTTTFSNVFAASDNDDLPTPQAYPGSFPDDENPPATGAIATNSLGYVPEAPEEFHEDVTYRLTFELTHTSDTLTFRVRGTGLQSYPNEGWGIDNVRVTAR